MTRLSLTLVAIFAVTAFAAEKKLALKDLSPALQKAVQEQAKGGEIKSISTEKENGVTQYEVDTMLNGKHRSFDLSTAGALLELEEETTLDSIPPAAKAAIEKKVAGGKIDLVETVTRGSNTFYEANYTAKGGKKHEVMVKPDGTPTKD
ncbi:MAG TPA: hypothetical protein VKU19_40635 [Bryobacteraceae bacterium]|nr:hypothetical protein [Bryobacteraceae bacterium]